MRPYAFSFLLVFTCSTLHILGHRARLPCPGLPLKLLAKSEKTNTLHLRRERRDSLSGTRVGIRHVSLQSTHGPYTRVFETSLARPGLLPRCVHDHSTRARPTTRSAARGVWRAHTETPRRARGIRNPYIYVASIFRPLHPMPNQFLKQMVMPSHPPRSSPPRRSPPHA